MRVVRIVPVLSIIGLVAACNPAPITPDAATSPDASMIDAPMGAMADVGSDASATGCVDLTGAWALSGTCSVAGFSPFPTACIAQTGCDAAISVSSGTIQGTVVGNRVIFETTVSSFPLACTATLTGSRLSVNCDAAGGAATCEATGTRGTVPGATRFCCDVHAQDCGAGQRCTPYASGAGVGDNVLSACVPAGALTLDAPCMREGGRVGAEPCGPGLFCTSVGQATPTTSVCRPLCTQTSECTAGQVCVSVQSVPRAGTCAPGCTLGETACSEGTTCRVRQLWETAPSAEGNSLTYGPSCDAAGPGVEGTPCASAAACGANLECARRAGGEFACRQFCSSTRACPTGFMCAEYNGFLNPSGFGACHPM